MKDALEQAFQKCTSEKDGFNGSSFFPIAIKQEAEEMLEGLKVNFLKDYEESPTPEMIFERKIQSIQEMFEGDTLWTIVGSNTIRFGKIVSRKEQPKTVLFDDAMTELQQERISADTTTILSRYYAHILLFMELTVGGLVRPIQGKEFLISPKDQPRLIWNGQKNTLAKIFYQMKNLRNIDGTPWLEITGLDLAIFLKQTFECYKENELSTIKGMIESKEQWPEKTEHKITLFRGKNPDDWPDSVQ